MAFRRGRNDRVPAEPGPGTRGNQKKASYPQKVTKQKVVTPLVTLLVTLKHQIKTKETAKGNQRNQKFYKHVRNRHMKTEKTRNSEKVIVRAAHEGPSLEKSLERRFREECERRGWICIKFESPGNAGVPDRIVIDCSGNVSFVELKKGRSAKTMARQWWWNGRLRSMGVKAFFVRDAESMAECIREMERAEGKGRRDED